MKLFDRLKRYFRIRVRWARIWFTRIVKFISLDMWSMDLSDIEHRKARLIKDAKVITLTYNTFANQKIGFQATALSYQSVMSFVPFLAIAFYLTGGLGLSDRLSAFLYANISNERLINTLLDASDNILQTAQSGLFGLISMLTFLWIVIWLMISVRRVFNNVWKVEKERNLLRTLGVIIGVIVFSPFVIILFFSGSIVYTHVLDLLVPGRAAFSEHIKSFLSWLIYAGVAILILSAMFKYIPGTKVGYRHAFKAAVIAGLVFMVLQYLYLETQVMVTKVSAVYGVLAALPLFLTYLNLGWTIVLYGAELSYAFQNVDNYSIEQIETMNQEVLEEKKRKRREL